MSDPTGPQRKLAADYVALPTAPTLFFDFVPTYGSLNGIIQLELATRALMPLQDGGVGTVNIETGRLRCSATAAKVLRDSIDAALKMLEQHQAAPVGAGDLN